MDPTITVPSPPDRHAQGVCNLTIDSVHPIALLGVAPKMVGTPRETLRVTAETLL